MYCFGCISFLLQVCYLQDEKNKLIKLKKKSSAACSYLIRNLYTTKQCFENRYADIQYFIYDQITLRLSTGTTNLKVGELILLDMMTEWNRCFDEFKISKGN